LSLKDYLQEDLNVIFNIDEFAETAEFNGEQIPVIFYEKSEELLDDGYLGYSPAILAKTADIKDIKTGDLIVFRDTNYYVTKKEFKDELTTKLYLSKDASTKF